MVVSLCCFYFVAGLVYCDYCYICCFADCHYYCIYYFDCYFIYCCCLNFGNFDFGLYLHFVYLVRDYWNERNDRRYYLNVNSNSLDLFVVELFGFLGDLSVLKFPSNLLVSWMLLPPMVVVEWLKPCLFWPEIHLWAGIPFHESMQFDCEGQSSIWTGCFYFFEVPI